MKPSENANVVNHAIADHILLKRLPAGKHEVLVLCNSIIAIEVLLTGGECRLCHEGTVNAWWY
jgi:hypothetical protein